MLLTEEDAAKIVLIRSVEECDKNIFSDQIVLDALAAGKNEAPGIAWVKARAQFLFDYLSPAYRAVQQSSRLPSPWIVPVCLLMLVIGFLTNLLGPSEKIHVVRNPVLLLVAWNLFVYVALAIIAVLRGSRKPARGMQSETAVYPELAKSAAPVPQARSTPLSWLASFFLPGLWGFLHRFAASVQEKAKLVEIARRFSVNWFAVAPELISARWQMLLHLGALFLALAR
ncbi:MAG: hypothetical protein FJ145_20885 [Deltaproteobacteria bacterium]|nr:hypothetical protein [Deltaproteobacteria bacterium]